MKRTYYKHGDWSAICDVCGFKFKASHMRKRWDGLMTCESDWEMRNPLDFIRPPMENVTVPWQRPEGSDTFITFRIKTMSGDNLLAMDGSYITTMMS